MRRGDDMSHFMLMSMRPSYVCLYPDILPYDWFRDGRDLEERASIRSKKPHF